VVPLTIFWSLGISSITARVMGLLVFRERG